MNHAEASDVLIAKNFTWGGLKVLWLLECCLNYVGPLTKTHVTSGQNWTHNTSTSELDAIIENGKPRKPRGKKKKKN